MLVESLTTDSSGARVVPSLEDEAVVVEEEPVTTADFGRCRGFAAFAFAASAIINFSMSSPFVPFRGVRWEPRPVHTDTGGVCVLGVATGSLEAGVDATGSSVADRRDCCTAREAASMHADSATVAV